VASSGSAEPGLRATLIACGLLTLAAAFWSGNWVFGRLVRFDAPPGSLTFSRWFIAALVLIVMCRRDWPSFPRVLREHWRVLLALALFASVLQHYPVYRGLASTTATTASLLNATTPVFILLISWIVLRERLGPAVVAGVAVSLCGATWIVARGEPASLLGLQLAIGDLWILLGTASWAVYTVCLRWRPSDVPARVLVALVAVLSSACTLPLAIGEHLLGQSLVLTPAVVAGILYIALGSTVLGYLCWNRGVQVLGANRAGPFMYLMTVFTPLMGWAFLGEHVEGFHLVGIVLVFSGIALTHLARRG
jgi:drug/metabolite transporter (DMT)-like permease